MRLLQSVRRSPIVIFALLGLLMTTPSALAQDVWRLAGTMNNWDPSDESWALAPTEGVLALDRVIEPGSYKFKFVRNGDWNSMHFGGAGDGSLEQPGRDLVMDVRARGG